MSRGVRWRRIASACAWLGAVMSILPAGVANAQADTSIEVLDAQGVAVRLERPAQRIIALAPHLVENLYAIGAGERIVGTVSYADYPAAAKNIPRIGNHQLISYEAVLSLKPDLILGWGSGNGGDMLSRLRELNMPLHVSEPRGFGEIAELLRVLGRLTGREAAAEAEAAKFVATLDGLGKRYSEAAPVAVFYEVWNAPLQTLNGEHLISQVMALCGGHNIFADAIPLAPRVSVEAVISRRPEVIIASGVGDARPDFLDDWRQWPQLPAVAGGHLYAINPDHIQRHTPRIALGAAAMCEQLERARP